MRLLLEFEPIREWARERGLIQSGDVKTQTVKLGEEYGELCHAIIKGNDQEARDAVGDMVVVLTNLCAQKGWRIEECINEAYNEIKDRKGSMQNGSFIKQQ